MIFSRVVGQDGAHASVDITHTTTAPVEPDFSFECHIGVEIKSEASDTIALLNVEAVGLFKLVGDFDERIWRNYQNISAPGLVYPYVRAFISNLTVMAGLTAVTIQPINFALAYELKMAGEASSNQAQPELPFDSENANE
ncbi:protein-export chaperone SecB [Hymenobacter sp.]|uniref:protein-export chaperone SecB n=1 Tax=Hymenobacter sp. TaxID=1898978 RepID=UPI00286B4ED8|nr:protein-export chaperone SecB [Hymenobacter sp.]